MMEKIYAGLIGMDAGMRLGAPVENPYWTYEQLREHYGDIRGYLRVHKNHPPDDDVNGPILFVRALTDSRTDSDDVRADAGTAAAGKEEQGGNGRLTSENSCFSRLTSENGCFDQLTPEMVGEAWLNYTRFGKGMFWWGGEDLSTEHRVYMNLRRGIKPPQSGSAEQNGKTASEQIGGQIFVDTWGLICPGNPEKAAEYAAAAASVSHDGNGVFGGMFMAACVAAAFEAETVDEILDKGLSVIPEDCDYARVVRAVRQFHAAHPDLESFRECRDYVAGEWGHDRFPGGWHIVPNAGICVTALLYGNGDLGRSIEISVMCGFDTDCNASNIGTILGVFRGLEGVPAKYREPINDTVLLSGCSGYLNMVDLPALAGELCEIAIDSAGTKDETGGKKPEAETRKKGDIVFDFALPGSTHGLRLSDRSCHSIRNIEADPVSGNRCLELMIDGKLPKKADLFFNGCFTEEDLPEGRYDPAFSPRVYPGQTVTVRMKAVFPAPAELEIRPFVTTAMSTERIELRPARFSGALVSPELLPGWDRQFDLRTIPDAASEGGLVKVDLSGNGDPHRVRSAGSSGNCDPAILAENTWVELCFTIPDLNGDQVHELGWQFDLKPTMDEWAFDFVYIDEITVNGPMEYEIDFSIQREEFGQITPFTFSDCTGTTEGDMLKIRMPEEPTAKACQAFTGNYYMRDVTVSALTEICDGESALLLLRGKGTRRYYALGFSGEGHAAILRYDSGAAAELASCSFLWEKKKRYRLEASACGNSLTLSVDGNEILSASDDRFAYGMIGMGMSAAGSCLWKTLHVRGR